MKAFIVDMLEGVIPTEDITKARFDKIYRELDSNGDGMIDEGEMLVFIRKVTGL